jgi:radical SAM protein with 4Fe4S-binding SPASM domain
MTLLPKGWRDYFLNLSSLVVRSPYVFGMPTFVFIETGTYCNLRCPACRTGNGNLKRPKGNMALNDFKRVVDQVKKYVNTISLYFMGEPFLNPDIYGMIRYANDNGIFTTTCTNGELLEPQRLIESGLNEIWFQIGGLTEVSHSLYRVGGKLNKVKENIVKLTTLRKKLNKDIEMVIGLIVMKHNEKSLKEFGSFCRDLDVDEGVKIIPRLYTIDQAERFLPEDKRFNRYDLEGIRRKSILKPLRHLPNGCFWLWFCTEITWEGNIIPCCEDEEAEFVMGNIFQEDLRSIWNNGRYIEFRRKILNGQKDIPICRYCLGLPPPLLNKI